MHVSGNTSFSSQNMIFSKITEQNLLYFAGLRVLSTHLIIIHEVLLRGLIFEWLYYQLSFRLLAIKDFESSVYNDIFLQIWLVTLQNLIAVYHNDMVYTVSFSSLYGITEIFSIFILHFLLFQLDVRTRETIC